MLEKVQSVWNLPLFRVSGDEPVHLGQLILVLAILVLGYLLSKLIVRLVRRKLNKSSLTPDAAHTLQRIVLYTLLTIVAATALATLNIPLAAFAFVSGAVAIGVGFGAQNIINNFISGWILMFERPVRIQDFIELDEHKGVVESIGNRSTRIRRTDGVHILVPNSQLLERNVINWTLVDREIRNHIRVGVAYGSPADLVAELLKEIINAHPTVKSVPEPLVLFEDFGDSALIFDSYFWSDVVGEKDLRVVRSDIRFRINQVFADNSITIAYPQRDVHLTTIKPLDVRIADSRQKD